VFLPPKTSDNTKGLSEKNLAKKALQKYIVSLATQLSQNQNKIFPGKVAVDIFIPESFLLPSAYKNFCRPSCRFHYYIWIQDKMAINFDASNLSLSYRKVVQIELVS